MFGVVGMAWTLRQAWSQACALPSLVPGPLEVLGLSETQCSTKEMEAEELV